MLIMFKELKEKNGNNKKEGDFQKVNIKKNKIITIPIHTHFTVYGTLLEKKNPLDRSRYKK